MSDSDKYYQEKQGRVVWEYRDVKVGAILEGRSGEATLRSEYLNKNFKMLSGSKPQEYMRGKYFSGTEYSKYTALRWKIL